MLLLVSLGLGRSGVFVGLLRSWCVSNDRLMCHSSFVGASGKRDETEEGEREVRGDWWCSSASASGFGFGYGVKGSSVQHVEQTTSTTTTR